MAAFGAVDLYLANEFGGIFSKAEAEVAPTTSATRLAKFNPERTGLIIVNLGAATVFVAPSQQVSTTRGILLIPNGGAISIGVRDDMLLPALEWWGATDVGVGDVYVLEVIRDTAFVLPAETK